MRTVRESVGVSQRELAKLLNLPQSYVSKIERGERQLQALELIELCRLLKVQPDDVIRTYASGSSSSPEQTPDRAPESSTEPA